MLYPIVPTSLLNALENMYPIAFVEFVWPIIIALLYGIIVQTLTLALLPKFLGLTLPLIYNITPYIYRGSRMRTRSRFDISAFAFSKFIDTARNDRSIRLFRKQAQEMGVLSLDAEMGDCYMIGLFGPEVSKSSMSDSIAMRNMLVNSAICAAIPSLIYILGGLCIAGTSYKSSLAIGMFLLVICLLVAFIGVADLRRLLSLHFLLLTANMSLSYPEVRCVKPDPVLWKYRRKFVELHLSQKRLHRAFKLILEAKVSKCREQLNSTDPKAAGTSSQLD